MKPFVIIMLVVLAGCAICFLLTKRSRTTIAGTRTNAQDNDFPPKPKWRPNVPVDIERIVKTMHYYAGTNGCFAVFSNGTCVRVDPTSATPEKDAIATLDGLFHQHPDFNPLAMDDGN